MSMVKTRRAAVVEQVQELGVVAVIRIKDPAKLRAVVDALVEGGVRALEVTMTGTKLVATMDGKNAVAAEDKRFAGVWCGVWTKTDSVTLFDDVTVQ